VAPRTLYQLPAQRSVLLHSCNRRHCNALLWRVRAAQWRESSAEVPKSMVACMCVGGCRRSVPRGLSKISCEIFAKTTPPRSRFFFGACPLTVRQRELALARSQSGPALLVDQKMKRKSGFDTKTLAHDECGSQCRLLAGATAKARSAVCGCRRFLHTPWSFIPSTVLELERSQELKSCSVPARLVHSVSLPAFAQLICKHVPSLTRRGWFVCSKES
jgi:hypothetical protein